MAGAVLSNQREPLTNGSQNAPWLDARWLTSQLENRSSYINLLSRRRNAIVCRTPSSESRRSFDTRLPPVPASTRFREMEAREQMPNLSLVSERNSSGVHVSLSEAPTEMSTLPIHPRGCYGMQAVWDCTSSGNVYVSFCQETGRINPGEFSPLPPYSF